MEPACRAGVSGAMRRSVLSNRISFWKLRGAPS
ncbi:hypothetical protein A2U01_0099017, partial [Trifolium medium]|nr:hypothetical protein [Trifolium medium]